MSIEELAALLADHADWMYALHSEFRTTTCVCGALEIGNLLDIEHPLAEEAHRAHVAEVIMPAIREHIAQEIEAATDNLAIYDQGRQDAARIVRGGAQ